MKHFLWATLLLSFSIHAFDGVYVLPRTVEGNSQYIVDGYKIVQNKFQTVRVVIGKNGVEQITNAGPVLKETPTFLSEEIYSAYSPKSGLNTIYCKSRFATATLEGDEIVVHRWSHVREVFMGCPKGKTPDKRGEANGSTDTSTLRFRFAQDEVFMETSYPDIPSFLPRQNQLMQIQ